MKWSRKCDLEDTGNQQRGRRNRRTRTFLEVPQGPGLNGCTGIEIDDREEMTLAGIDPDG